MRLSDCHFWLPPELEVAGSNPAGHTSRVRSRDPISDPSVRAAGVNVRLLVFQVLALDLPRSTAWPTRRRCCVTTLTLARAVATLALPPSHLVDFTQAVRAAGMIAS